MSIWYRAHTTKSVKNVFSGDGGLYVAGRWNHKGRRVVYCSQSISLCSLEWLAHNGLSVSGFSYYKYQIEIPSKLILKIKHSDLPKSWNRSPPTRITRDLTEEKLFNQSKYLAITVPSVMVPEENNLVINPLHNSFDSAIKSIKTLGSYAAPKR